MRCDHWVDYRKAGVTWERWVSWYGSLITSGRSSVARPAANGSSHDTKRDEKPFLFPSLFPHNPIARQPAPRRSSTFQISLSPQIKVPTIFANVLMIAAG